jgi:hypothetical protein
MVHDLLLNQNGRPRDTPGLTNPEKREKWTMETTGKK